MVVKLPKLWEQSYPIAIGISGGLAWLYVGPYLLHYGKSNDWHFDQIYPAVFGFLSITTGFLATFYGSIQAMSDGFIKAVRDTQVMRQFLSYIKTAIIVGFVMALLSIPMMIIQPLPLCRYSLWNVVVSVWLAGSCWAVAGFWRVAKHSFFVFETRLPDNKSGG